MDIQPPLFGGIQRPYWRHIFSFVLCIVLGIMSLGLISCQGTSDSEDALAVVQKRGYLIVGVNYGNPPFGLYSSSGHHYELKGFDIDLSRAIAKRLLPKQEEPVQFRQVLTSTRLVALNTRDVDMIVASMSITPNRKQRVAFSSPYFTVHQRILVPANSPIQSIDDLNGKTVLTINGSTAQSRLQKQYPNIHIKSYATLNDAFLALQHNEGDAFSNDDVLLEGLFMQDCALKTKYKLLPEQLSTEYYGLVFRKTTASKPNYLQQQVDEILMQLSQDGTLEVLKKRWLQTGCF